jgi:adenine-specific DNA methylase
MMAESPIATELTKRLRALKKKLTKISAIEVMEESKRNKEQVALLATKGDVECCIRELDAFKSKLDSLDLLGSDRPSCEMGNSGSKSTTSKKAKTQEGSVNETNAGPSDAGAAKSVQLRVVASEGPECTYQQVRHSAKRLFFLTFCT